MLNPNMKACAALMSVTLAFAGCGGDDEEQSADTNTAPAPQVTTADDRTETTETVKKKPPKGPKPKRGEDGRYNNDPAVEGDEGTEAVGTLDVFGREFKLERSEQALLTEGVWEVTFHNKGTITHALDVEGPNGESESGEVAPGGKKTFKVYFVNGEYELYCPLGDHADKGMRTELPLRG